MGQLQYNSVLAIIESFYFPLAFYFVEGEKKKLYIPHRTQASLILVFHMFDIFVWESLLTYCVYV